MTLRRLVECHECFGGIYCLHLQSLPWLSEYMASHTRRQPSGSLNVFFHTFTSYIRITFREWKGTETFLLEISAVHRKVRNWGVRSSGILRGIMLVVVQRFGTAYRCHPQDCTETSLKTTNIHCVTEERNPQTLILARLFHVTLIDLSTQNTAQRWSHTSG